MGLSKLGNHSDTPESWCHHLLWCSNETMSTNSGSNHALLGSLGRLHVWFG